MRCYNDGCRASAQRYLVSSGRVQGTQGIGRRGGIRLLDAPTNQGAVWNRSQGRYDLPAAASLQSFAVCPSTPRLKTTWFLCSSKVGGSARPRRSSLYQLCGAALGTTSFTMTREAAITLTLTLAVPLTLTPTLTLTRTLTLTLTSGAHLCSRPGRGRAHDGRVGDDGRAGEWRCLAGRALPPGHRLADHRLLRSRERARQRGPRRRPKWRRPLQWC